MKIPNNKITLVTVIGVIFYAWAPLFLYYHGVNASLEFQSEKDEREWLNITESIQYRRAAQKLLSESRQYEAERAEEDAYRASLQAQEQKRRYRAEKAELDKEMKELLESMK